MRLIKQWLDAESRATYGRPYAEIQYEAGMDSRAQAGAVTLFAPYRTLCERVWPNVDARGSSERRLRTIMRDQKTITFDLADRILCAIDCVDAWRYDPELSEAYDKLNWLAIDLAKPTCEAAAEESIELVEKMYHALDRSARSTSKALGLPLGLVSRTIHNPPAVAA